MFSPLGIALDKVITAGDLRVIDAVGATHVFGDGGGQRVVARLTDRRVEWALALDPALALGEAYMDGRLVMVEGSIYDFIELLDRNAYGNHRRAPGWSEVAGAWRYATRALRQINTLQRSKRNVERHYDHPYALYELFLDADRQYSCAYFGELGATLEEAQLAKMRRLAAKLQLADGLQILDIGSGWGGLALHLARLARVSVTGVTLSEQQLRVSRERARQSAMAERVDFQLQDYRRVRGAFDRVVSVGMLEHVGAAHLTRYFATIRELLASGGAAVVHAIGRSEGPNGTNPFLAKYIFPGGYIPALSETLAAVERAGLYVMDVEIWRMHYALTLRCWRERFMEAREKAVALMGERFCRMWEFYLAGSESAFRHEGMMVFQLCLVKSPPAAPSTRDYMYVEAQQLAEADELSSDSARRRMRIVNGVVAASKKHFSKRGNTAV